MDLSDQIVNSSMQNVLNESRIMEGESRTVESHARERELVKRSIERARKQLQQIVLADLGMNPVNISLVKKYKTFPTKGSVPRPVSFLISLSTSHIYALSLPFHFRISTPYPVARFTLPFSIHAFSLLIPLALFVIFPLSISVVVPVSLSRALPVFTGAVFTLPLSTIGAVARSISSLPRP